MTIIAPLASKPCREKIAPANDAGHDDDFGAECQACPVEDVTGSGHRLARLDRTFIASDTQASVRVNFWPCCRTLGKLVPKCRFYRGVIPVQSDPCNGPVGDPSFGRVKTANMSWSFGQSPFATNGFVGAISHVSGAFPRLLADISPSPVADHHLAAVTLCRPSTSQPGRFHRGQGPTQRVQAAHG